MAKAKRQITHAARRREAPTHHTLTAAPLEVSRPSFGSPALVEHRLGAEDHRHLVAASLTVGQHLPKPRKRPHRSPTRTVACELYPPDGEPPETVLTKEAIQRLVGELVRRKITVRSTDTLKRALHRR